MPCLLLGALGSPRIEALHRLWSERRREERAPPAAAIDPRAIGAAILPRVLLVEPTGADYRYRLVGTLIARVCGDFTGRRLSEIAWGSNGGRRRAVYDRCAATAEPLFGDDLFACHPDRGLRARWGVFPWLGADGRVSRLLEVLDFELPQDLVYRAGWTGPPSGSAGCPEASGA